MKNALTTDPIFIPMLFLNMKHRWISASPVNQSM